MDVRPRIVCSRCIEFDHTRFDGGIIRSQIVSGLKQYVEMIPICPEVEIGLGIPRKPLRIVEIDRKRRLIQPAHDLDHTMEMEDFTTGFLDGLEDVDGFIMKAKSPSCGMGDVKIYHGTAPDSRRTRGNGFFSGEVRRRYGGLPAEDERRLENDVIRDHFLTGIYTMARFREVRDRGGPGDLVRFHADNKFLLMAYGEKDLRIMGGIVAKQSERSFDDVLDDYFSHLVLALKRGPQYTGVINVLQHALGHFKNDLKTDEKGYFIDALAMYREGRIPLSSLKSIMGVWIVRFDNEYLGNQTFFRPYPDGLILGHEKHRGRDLWR
jgi:uncharacterized protein YbgA (DUF1722 family)/uncharacterized protein YbbK (DUF523 family)